MTRPTALLFGLLCTTAFANPAKRSICNAGRMTIGGKQYTISCGIDRPGGDYGRLQTDFNGCIAACGGDSTCVTAQYHEDNGYCYLKNSVNGPVQIAGEDTIDLGSACQQNAVITLSGVQCTISCGVDRRGGDYTNSRTGNYLTCAQACAADSNCVTAQYNEGNGYCYMKNQLNPASGSSDTDTIVCQRPALSSTTSSSTTSSSTTSSSTTSSSTTSSSTTSSSTTSSSTTSSSTTSSSTTPAPTTTSSMMTSSTTTSSTNACPTGFYQDTTTPGVACRPESNCNNPLVCDANSVCDGNSGDCYCQPDASGRGLCNSGFQCGKGTACTANSDCPTLQVCFTGCCPSAQCIDLVAAGGFCPNLAARLRSRLRARTSNGNIHGAGKCSSPAKQGGEAC